MRAEMDALIYQYQVNAMLVGHQHSYGLTCCGMAGTGEVTYPQSARARCTTVLAPTMAQVGPLFCHTPMC
jgi:hypothetical protein